MTKTEIAQQYQAILKQEGFSPEIDSDGDVTFKYEAGLYVIIIDEKDPTFLRLCYPNFLDTESAPDSILSLYKSIDTANRRVKVAKVYFIQDDIWANVEVYLPEISALKDSIQQYLRILQTIVKDTINNLSEEMADSKKA